MTSRTEGVLLMGLLLVLSCVFQIQLKLFAMETGTVFARAAGQGLSLFEQIFRSIINWRTLVVLVLGGGLALVWILALQRLDLSLALPLAAVALAVNALVGGWMLGEAMAATRILGIGIITAGVFLVIRT